MDGDCYLKEQTISLRYQNRMLKEENKSLKDKLENFKEWIGEKVKDVGRGR